MSRLTISHTPGLGSDCSNDDSGHSCAMALYEDLVDSGGKGTDYVSQTTRQLTSDQYMWLTALNLPFVFQRSVFDIYRMLMQQSIEKEPRTPLPRIFLGIWLVFCLLISGEERKRLGETLLYF